ncbi:hemolysin [Brasilonema octagenarum UFV-E1]|uniref:Hemolysin n=1 Tax=Brasilonema sennae CENA114 TaxID=415709 RepID=A0A856MBW8_9CYAN|nr:right-handed parallel beta-helix repeat-containing protein [Brasilonema sennae]QDL07820.1 hemolysin [Brasilonema sennae CENA114]QDL14180.1 hemolysin [Brasilonema octagenarum UFV-E1]
MSTINVTSNADNGAGSLREAIAQAKSDDTIQFGSNLANQTINLTSGELTVDKNLTVDGASTTGLTISGNNASRIFDVTTPGSSFTLRNLTLVNGKSSGEGENGAGGAIRTISSDKLTTLNVENSKFINNASSGNGGGAIWAGFNTANTITNSLFEGNDGTAGKSERGGGAIAVNTNSTLTVKNSEFDNNKGTNGGAINSVLSTLTVEDSTFRNNDSTAGGPIGPNTIGYGGAIYTDGANASGPNFDHGSVGGTITIRNSKFEGNKAVGQGGGLFLYAYPPDKIIVDNSTITKNEVVADSQGDSLGGGLRIGNGEFTINNTTFTDNRALNQGGGLWVGEQSPGTITKSTFSGNRAESTDGKNGLGGAIALANNSNPVTIDGTTVANNYAGWQGGGIFGGGSSTTLTNSTFANNVAYNGGNNWNIKNQATDQLSDGGGNTQWPAKNSNDPTDINVTASINIAQPDLSNLQNTGQNVTNSLTENNSNLGTAITPAAVSDYSSSKGTSVDAISNSPNNNPNDNLTPVAVNGNSSSNASDGSLTQVPGNDSSSSNSPIFTEAGNSLLCGNLTKGDHFYSGLSQDTLIQGKAIDNSVLTPSQSSELNSQLNSGQDYVSLLDTLTPSHFSSSQPGQDSSNVDNIQPRSLANLDKVNTPTLSSNPQFFSGQSYSTSTL